MGHLVDLHESIKNKEQNLGVTNIHKRGGGSCGEKLRYLRKDEIQRGSHMEVPRRATLLGSERGAQNGACGGVSIGVGRKCLRFQQRIAFPG